MWELSGAGIQLTPPARQADSSPLGPPGEAPGWPKALSGICVTLYRVNFLASPIFSLRFAAGPAPLESLLGPHPEVLLESHQLSWFG